ncbi:hypothetical protein UA08_02409 [Talaromyces atroroseus]|uniref:Uncharacterized protein n=1 Tax=Talaromyces atroroseus TaxID=1441469 RepID=A0A225AKH1_TALAT|nr:hypothetical protein UA08_02409 [Talaromyces atroroseus]OKL62051.1 hypothetical protein UA08_02409 [Talaromyces atroroseus]
MARYPSSNYSHNGRETVSAAERRLLKRIRSLEDLNDPVVDQLRVTTNMTKPLPITGFSVSPTQFSMFLFRALRLPPVSYDALTRRIILYPPLSIVQRSLIQIFNNWLYVVSKRMQTLTNKAYERMLDVQLGLGGRYQDSYYFTHLALRESGAKHANIILETGRGMPNSDGREFGSSYIYEKAARWFEGSNGTVRLIIIILVTEDPLLPLRPSPTSSATSHLPSKILTPSNTLYWGLTSQQILKHSVSSLANHIILEDLKSDLRTKVDIYCATQSYPGHRGYAEHVWHGTFETSGHLCTDHTSPLASSFSLPSLLLQKVKVQGEEKDFRIPFDEFCVLLPRAIKESRAEQAAHLARTTQEMIRKSRI